MRVHRQERGAAKAGREGCGFFLEMELIAEFKTLHKGGVEVRAQVTKDLNPTREVFAGGF